MSLEINPNLEVVTAQETTEATTTTATTTEVTAEQKAIEEAKMDENEAVAFEPDEGDEEYIEINGEKIYLSELKEGGLDQSSIDAMADGIYPSAEGAGATLRTIVHQVAKGFGNFKDSVIDKAIAVAGAAWDTAKAAGKGFLDACNAVKDAVSDFFSGVDKTSDVVDTPLYQYLENNDKWLQSGTDMTAQKKGNKILDTYEIGNFFKARFNSDSTVPTKTQYNTWIKNNNLDSSTYTYDDMKKLFEYYQLIK